MIYKIFDMDGCISDDDWRRGLPKRLYHNLCYLDSLINSEYLTGNLIINTGRPNEWRERTLDWLRLYKIKVVSIFMRNTRESEVIVKKNNLEKILKLYPNIEVAYDNNPAVIGMYKNFGINGVVLTKGGD